MKNHIYKIKVHRSLHFPKSFKISSNEDIQNIIEKIREQCNGNLLTFCDLKNNYLSFDRGAIDGIDVKEVK